LQYREDWLQRADKTDTDLAIQVQIAETHGRLARVAIKLGNPAESKVHLLDCKELYQLILAAGPSPENPGHRKAAVEIAGVNIGLGDVSLQLGTVEVARDFLDEALQTLEVINANTIESRLSARANVGVVYGRIGECDLLLGRPSDALQHYGKAIGLFEQLVSEDSLNATLKRNLSIMYTGYAEALKKLDDKQSAEFLEKSLSLREELHADDPADVRGYTDLMHALARAGQYQRAIELADGLSDRASNDPRLLFHIACSLSLSAQAAQADPQASDELSSSYGQRCIESLKDAIANGYRGRAKLQFDPDLEFVRGLPEFAEVLEQLDALMDSAAESRESDQE